MLLNNPGEQSRHYDIICLSLITIGSGALAAIFLLTNLPDLLPLKRGNLPALPQWGSLLAATTGTIAFAWMMINAKSALFDPQKTQAAEVQHKRHLASNMFNIILGMAVMLVVILIINIGAAAAPDQEGNGTKNEPTREVQEDRGDPLPKN